MHYVIDTVLSDFATEVINLYHQDLKCLRIAYLFRPKAIISNNKVTVGKAIKVDDRNWTLHGIDAIIEIAQDVWLKASVDFRKALMDHELSHIQVIKDSDDNVIQDENSNRIRIKLRSHDIEEFAHVLNRHGAYHEQLEAFLAAHVESKDEAGLPVTDLTFAFQNLPSL